MNTSQTRQKRPQRGARLQARNVALGFHGLPGHSATENLGAVRATQPASINPQPSTLNHAFTLLELLVVIGIVALVAAMTLPVLSHFKPSYTASATRRLLDDLARARQLAISQRTTVYMVFVPTNFWTHPSVTPRWRPEDWRVGTNLLDKQLVGYAFVSLRSLGDQPGRPTARYLSNWRTLPQGAFIAWPKFATDDTHVFSFATNDASGNPVSPGFQIFGFSKTSTSGKPAVPFPLADTPRYSPNNPYVPLPYIAFDYMGRLATGRDEQIPLAKGSVTFSRDPSTKVARAVAPTLNEEPPGNATNTNSYNVVWIDWLTGRAHLEHQEVQ